MLLTLSCPFLVKRNLDQPVPGVTDQMAALGTIGFSAEGTRSGDGGEESREVRGMCTGHMGVSGSLWLDEVGRLECCFNWSKEGDPALLPGSGFHK